METNKTYKRPKYSIGEEVFAVLEEPKKDGSGTTFTIMDFNIVAVGVDVDIKEGKDMTFYKGEAVGFGVVEECCFSNYEAALNAYFEKRQKVEAGLKTDKDGK